MELAPFPAARWAASEPRSRIVLYAWYAPAVDPEPPGRVDRSGGVAGDADCAAAATNRVSEPR
jgi:hypothetical protein